MTGGNVYTHKLLQSLIHLPSTLMYMNDASAPTALPHQPESQISSFRSSHQFSDCSTRASSKCDVWGRVNIMTSLSNSSLDILSTCTRRTQGRGSSRSRSLGSGKGDVINGSGVRNLGVASHRKPYFMSSPFSSWKSEMKTVLSPSAFQQVCK